jgi:hypothetical protein
MDTLIKSRFAYACALLFFTSTSCALLAEELYRGDPFKAADSGFKISWGNDVGKLPETVPHYAASDHPFGQRIIQYFKKLGNFTSESRIPPLDHWVTRKDTEIYESGSKNLNISPVTGSMIYRSNQDSNNRDLPEAPTVDEAKKLAEKLLIELGFDVAAVSFEHVRHTSGTQGRHDRALGKVVTSRSSAGLFIPRLYEGWPSDFAGVNVAFGLGGELTEFSFCWRDVKLAGQRKVPTREEIAKQILDGRATVMMDAAQNASSLTIKKIAIVYREAEPFKKSDIVEPVLLIKADATVNGVTVDCTLYLKLAE